MKMKKKGLKELLHRIDYQHTKYSCLFRNCWYSGIDCKVYHKMGKEVFS